MTRRTHIPQQRFDGIKYAWLYCCCCFLFSLISHQTAEAQKLSNDVNIQEENVVTTFLATTDALISNFWGASFPESSDQFYFYSWSQQANKKNEWWWQAHSMDVIIDAYRLTGDTRYLQFYEQWYDGICRFNYEHYDDDPWRNNSVDDLEWITITLIRMYETSGNEKYLLKAQHLYDSYIITTWGPDDEAPWFGGISWEAVCEPERKTKNACSNGPGAIIAAMLARHGSVLMANGSKKTTLDYENDLKRIYQWERKYLFNPETGAVYDNINRRRTAYRVASYNTGTFLAAAMDMYALTHDRDYLHDAIMAADYTVCNLTDPTTGLMNNVARSMNGGDGGLFHGIFFRYLTRLILCSDTPDEMRNSLRRFVADNARLAMSCLDGEAMIFSRNWLTESIGKNEPAPLTPHVTGCTLLAAQIEVMRNY